jgi:hypothetical protein
MHENAAGVASLIGYTRPSSKKEDLWELFQRIHLNLCKLLLHVSQYLWEPLYTQCLSFPQLTVQLQFSLPAKKYKLLMCLNEMDIHAVIISMIVLYCVITKRMTMGNSLLASPILL